MKYQYLLAPTEWGGEKRGYELLFQGASPAPNPLCHRKHPLFSNKINKLQLPRTNDESLVFSPSGIRFAFLAERPRVRPATGRVIVARPRNGR
ncbi:hypothetical protein [Sulfitobacter pacificus]|uniref:hypothetical protein n=1 Tax=Sulfitobacter pacificus TaxID=1499314 RepID=UPI0024E12314|nr:hypothetical protein [Sulfitobacter pacificus]